jgi:hypothetical protein
MINEFCCKVNMNFNNNNNNNKKKRNSTFTHLLLPVTPFYTSYNPVKNFEVQILH